MKNDTPETPVKKDQLLSEEEYHARMDADFEEAGRRLKRNKRIRLFTTFVVLGGAVGGAFYWYNSDTANQEKVHNIVTEAVAVKDALKEGTDVMGMMDSYDEALDDISMHGENIEAAAVALSGKGELKLEQPAKTNRRGRDDGKEPAQLAEVTKTTEEANSASDSQQMVTQQSVDQVSDTPARRGF